MAELLQDAAGRAQSLTLFGNNSKRLMGGPCLAADASLSMARLNRILQYEPNDLTISVEAGLRWTDLQKTLARNLQMLALDPPFASQATVGGVIASNSSGPLRARFGTARDLVIGMQFATLEGKLVRTGGMVVKNVAGLDMGKLMIGSFGTLAVITSVNLRLHPLPEKTSTFLFSFSAPDAALEKRAALQSGVLRPLAVDLIGPVVAARLGHRGFLLAVRAGGSARILERYGRELSGSERISGTEEELFWTQIREFPAELLRRQPGSLILRISAPLSQTSQLLRLAGGSSITRASAGVHSIYLSGWPSLKPFWRAAAEQQWAAVVEYAPDEVRLKRELWLLAQQNESAFAMMKSIKQMFDPGNLLNRLRLYGRL